MLISMTTISLWASISMIDRKEEGCTKRDKDMGFHLDLSQDEVEYLPLPCFLPEFEADHPCTWAQHVWNLSLARRDF